MKKLLLTTTLLIATAGAAAADVKISGSGRFGLVYNDGVGAGLNKSVIENRLRFNIDASFAADNGVTYGGRIRMQDDNYGGATLNAAQLSMSVSGLTVLLGNADGAMDDAALIWDTELGYRGVGDGDPMGNFYGYSSGPYSSAREGIFLGYSMSGLNLRASYIQSNQYVSGSTAETALSADYTTGAFTVSAAMANNAGGNANDNEVFVGAAYAMGDTGKVGINYNDSSWIKTTTLYGNYKVGGATVGAYAVDSNNSALKTGYGLGVSYDLGGATLAGSIHKSIFGNTYGDLGISMSF